MSQPLPGIELDLAQMPSDLRRAIERQLKAFLLPAREGLISELRQAGIAVPDTLSLTFALATDATPDDAEWCRSLPASSTHGLGSPSSDFGLALLERALVQLITDHGGESLSTLQRHTIASRAIERHVDSTHVLALPDVSQETNPSSPPVTGPRRSPRRADVLVVSVAANAHDTSVAIATDDDVLIVLEAERVFRRKHKWCNAAELETLIDAALAATGNERVEVTHWTGTAMYNNLLPEAQRYCEWTDTHRIQLGGSTTKFDVVNHHLAHAAIAFATDIETAVVEASDGGGDNRQYAAFDLEHGELRPKTLPDEGFSAVFYDAVSYYVYKRFGCEGKFMGLAGHGVARPEFVDWLETHADLINRLPYEDSYELLDNYFRLRQHDPDRQLARDLACAAQQVFERRRVDQILGLSADTHDIILTGGAALNIHANTAIADRLNGHTVFVPPCCDDTGQALGALLYTMQTQLGVLPRVALPFLGRGDMAPREIDSATASAVVDDLFSGNVLAWHWGRAEIGPRALGHRSLLGLPFTVDDRVKISETVKGRESYRPVAPVILEDRLTDWFTPGRTSPYMLFAAHATDHCREHAAGVVHVDGSARVQTVSRDEQPLGPILSELEQRCGVPILINTSLNGPGEPIVDSHADTLTFTRGHAGVVSWLEGTRHGP